VKEPIGSCAIRGAKFSSSVCRNSTAPTELETIIINCITQKEKNTMKTSLISRKGFALTALLLGLVLPAQQSWAGAKLFDNSADAAATRFNGTVETNATNNRDPFVAQVFTSGAECLRIAVVSQGTDLEATLVSPTGRVWQDDDGGGSLRPLIKAITDVRGWYPLVLSHFVGSSVNADFTIDITRLPSSSSLCAPATAPRILLAPAVKSERNSETMPAGGAN
jgi:hypothetical protein